MSGRRTVDESQNPAGSDQEGTPSREKSPRTTLQAVLQTQHRMLAAQQHTLEELRSQLDDLSNPDVVPKLLDTLITLQADLTLHQRQVDGSFVNGSNVKN